MVETVVWVGASGEGAGYHTNTQVERHKSDNTSGVRPPLGSLEHRTHDL